MSVEQDTLPGIPGQVNTFSQPLRIFTSTLCQIGTRSGALAPLPLTPHLWSGRSCPLPLTLLLFLT
jgi:hypothetical protein